MIFLGIGSNLTSSFGNRFKNIDLSIYNLEKQKIKVIKKSSYYETPSYPDSNNPKFINIVIQVETKLNFPNLISNIMSVEQTLERKRNIKNDPRTCDIDILDYFGKIIEYKHKNLDFTIPHDQLIYRNFVLYPLKEISPYWKHPKNNISIDNLILNLSEEDKKSILKVKKC